MYLLIVCEAQNTNENSTSIVAGVVTDPPSQGWTPGPNGRGTMNIIYSCGITMFLCSWSIICLNVPGPDDSPFRLFRRGLYITALAFLGPEFLFQIALGQLISARSSVKEFRELGNKDWTMTHAFYADVGGCMLRSKGWPQFPDGWTEFPINAKQFYYLWTKGYIEIPKLTREDFRDKNKVDMVLRIFTIVQIVWFVFDMAWRRAQNLAVTCGELTTLAFIVCSFGTVLCWIYKPADVTTSVIIETNATIAEILCQA